MESLFRRGAYFPPLSIADSPGQSDHLPGICRKSAPVIDFETAIDRIEKGVEVAGKAKEIADLVNAIARKK
ncbi:MAG: hypothetical protein PSX80_16890 [bacterium]|nr:hypothetical protein [bacterium]